MYNGVNFGKRCVTIDLTQPQGIELVKDMVRQSDIVTENFAAGVMERMGLGYEELRKVKPDIIMLSGSPLGQDGPDKDATGFGPNTQAYAGLPYIHRLRGRHADRPRPRLPRLHDRHSHGLLRPRRAASPQPHRRGPVDRDRDGGDGDLDDPGGGAGLHDERARDAAARQRHPHFAPRGVYRSSGDDRWVAISVEGDEQWRAFGEALGSPIGRPIRASRRTRAGSPTTTRSTSGSPAWTRERTHYEAAEQLQAHAVPSAPVLDTFETLEDPQLNALGAFVETVHPEVGKRRLAGLPGRFSAIPDVEYGVSPLLGEHTEEVLCGLLGLSAEELAELTEQGITV